MIDPRIEKPTPGRPEIGASGMLTSNGCA